MILLIAYLTESVISEKWSFDSRTNEEQKFNIMIVAEIKRLNRFNCFVSEQSVLFMLRCCRVYCGSHHFCDVLHTSKGS